ncbi:MAG TPA: hypothetical protein VM241_05120 [Candidatus Thermoplasmatota archaeon]|nr:hypothetical protein [Candidatus Thermoplasmatota archaeon]
MGEPGIRLVTRAYAISAVSAVALLGGCFASPASPCRTGCRSSWDEAASSFWDEGHIEGRMPDGSWMPVDEWPGQPVPVFWMAPLEQALPEDLTPTPLGGGGQEVEVVAGAPVKVDLRLVTSVHFPPGSIVEWVRAAPHFFDPDDPAIEVLGMSNPDAVFEAPFGQPGLHPVAVRVYDGEGTPVFYSWTTEAVHVGASWSFEGQVQPQHPREGAGPFVEPAAMADRFLLPSWAEYKPLTAHTEYRGTWAPGQGSDVSLGLYDGEAREIQCSRTDGLGPEGTREEVNTTVRSTGIAARGLTYQLWVGYTPGFFCAPSFDHGYYANPTPVPYRLRLTLWPTSPAFL